MHAVKESSPIAVGSVSSEMSLLAQHIGQLENSVDALTGRISDVVVSRPPQNVGKTADAPAPLPPTRCALAEDICTLKQKVAQIIDTVESTRERLGLS